VSSHRRAAERVTGHARTAGEGGDGLGDAQSRVRLPIYDIRVRRELAHRRFVTSLLRQILRVASLHAADALAAVVAFWIARLVSQASISVEAIPAFVLFMLVGLNVRGSYRAGDSRRDGQRLVTGVLVGIVMISLPATMPREFASSREFVAVFGLTCMALLIVERRAVDALVHYAYAHGYGLRRALLVARPHDSRDIMTGLLPPNAIGPPAEDQLIVGYVSPEPYRSGDATALGTVADLEAILDAHDVSEVLVATRLPNEQLALLAESCFERGVRVLILPPAPQALRGWAELTRVGRLPAYQLHPARLELPALVLKRATDLVLASAGLVTGAPLMLLIALCIKLESRGAVFFRQRRVGLGGREFLMWKFRSMYHEAETRMPELAHLNAYEDARLFKLRHDPRITRVGAFLRRFSLDELPQLANVIAGDMSLVGPRPPLPAEVRRYERRHYIRLSVVPGLTGPWQVNGRNLITDFEEIVRLEREYIESWSLRSDLEIIFRTVGVVLSGKGAY
jgi:exopolysaccharide biosynthesis polyprenyl glycosylphosphotransferase